MPFPELPAPPCHGQWRRAGQAIQRSCMRPRRKRTRSCTGGPSTPTWTRSCAPRGTGGAPIRTAMATAERPRRVGGDLPPLQRLFAYSRPYRGRLGWAFVGMLVYAVGTAGLPVLIKLVINDVLPKQQYLFFTA